jgi:hypothetical protein
MILTIYEWSCCRIAQPSSGRVGEGPELDEDEPDAVSDEDADENGEDDDEDDEEHLTLAQGMISTALPLHFLLS